MLPTGKFSRLKVSLKVNVEWILNFAFTFLIIASHVKTSLQWGKESNLTTNKFIASQCFNNDDNQFCIKICIKLVTNQLAGQWFLVQGKSEWI